MPLPKSSRSGILRLKEIRPTLDTLHQLLLHAERDEYENVFGKVSNPANMLQLLLQDPWFAWLRALSRLMANIDETLDGKIPPTEADAEVRLEETLALLTPAEEGAGFAKEYYDALQRDPDVVMTHAAILKIIRS